MSTDHRDPRTAEALLEREMAESVIRARKALNRYVKVRDSLALNNEDPESHPRTYRALKDVHEATLDAFKYLSDYIEEEFADEFWNKKVVGYDDGKPIVLGRKPPEEITDDGEIIEPDAPKDVRYLEEYYGAVRERPGERHQEFVGAVPVMEYEPALLNFEVYDTTIRILFKIMKRAEFAPQAPMREVESDPLL